MLKIKSKRILLSFLISVTLACQVGICYTQGGVKERYSGEVATLRLLGLKPDAKDSEILQMLDDANKQILATLLIRQRKITSAVPKLVEIVKSDNSSLITKMSVSGALCDFGNTEWVPFIKKELTPKRYEKLHFITKIEIAGLLARADDHSQLKLVLDNINSKDDLLRHFVIMNLGYFRDKNQKTTSQAIDALVFAATSDPKYIYREHAIQGLEKIAQRMPEVKEKVREVSITGAASPDKEFKRSCEMRLKIMNAKKK